MAAMYHVSTANAWKEKLLAIAAALPDHVVVFAFQTHGRSVAAGKVGIINLKGAGGEARSSAPERRSDSLAGGKSEFLFAFNSWH